jgi:DNA ligase 1
VRYLLAQTLNELIDPKGWLASEKLDGFRSYWNGRQLFSRNKDGGLGNVFHAPSWFIKDFPNEPLDGELWAGRGKRDLVASAVKGSRERDWQNIQYATFDVPEFKGPFEKRLKHLQLIFRATHGIVLPFWVCTGRAQLLKRLDEIVDAGGEGIMLRKPGSKYEGKRSHTLLKVKKWFDAEAWVVGHVEGTRPGLCGALMVVNGEGKKFKVASGLTEKMAKNPPIIGTVITYRWNTLTKSGIPNPASFGGIREDL